MIRVNFKGGNVSRGVLSLLLSGFLAVVSGCSTQPAAPADPFAALEILDVKFAHQPPADAKFIAKVPFSSGSYDHWEQDCLTYLRAKAVKLHGNVVVPGVELYYQNQRIYNDQLFEDRSAVMAPGYREHYHPALNNQAVAPGKIYFWSNIYYSPSLD